ncbi:MAG: hypothetical protein Q9218_004169 [Villophora microphyllina]
MAIVLIVLIIFTSPWFRWELYFHWSPPSAQNQQPDTQRKGKGNNKTTDDFEKQPLQQRQQ